MTIALILQSSCIEVLQNLCKSRGEDRILFLHQVSVALATSERANFSKFESTRR